MTSKFSYDQETPNDKAKSLGPVTLEIEPDGDRIFKCPKCYFTSKRKYNVQHHLKTVDCVVKREKRAMTTHDVAMSSQITSLC